MSDNDPQRKTFNEKVTQDSQDIAGFLGTRRGGWTVISIGIIAVLCAISAWVL